MALQWFCTFLSYCFACAVSSESALLRNADFAALVRHSTVVTPFTRGPVQTSELYAATLWAAKVVQREVFGDVINVLRQRPEQFALATRSAPSEAIHSALLSVTNLHPFVAQDGLLWVGRWLRRVRLVYDTMHQIFLPKAHPFMRLLILHYHGMVGLGGYPHALALVQRRF